VSYMTHCLELTKVAGKAAKHPHFGHRRRALLAEIKKAFTDYSLVTAIMRANRKGHPSGQGLGYAILGTHHATGIRVSRIRRTDLPA